MEANKYTTPPEIIKMLRAFCMAHDQIHTVYTGTESEVDLNTITPKDCPFVFFGLGQATFDSGLTQVDIEMVVADVYIPNNRDNPGDDNNFEVVTIQSGTLQLLKDVLSYIKHQHAEGYTNSDTFQGDMTLPVVCTPFATKYKEHLTGWSATVTVEFNSAHDLCIVPQ